MIIEGYVKGGLRGGGMDFEHSNMFSFYFDFLM